MENIRQDESFFLSSLSWMARRYMIWVIHLIHGRRGRTWTVRQPTASKHFWCSSKAPWRASTPTSGPCIIFRQSFSKIDDKLVYCSFLEVLCAARDSTVNEEASAWLVSSNVSGDAKQEKKNGRRIVKLFSCGQWTVSHSNSNKQRKQKTKTTQSISRPTAAFIERIMT